MVAALNHDPSYGSGHHMNWSRATSQFGVYTGRNFIPFLDLNDPEAYALWYVMFVPFVEEQGLKHVLHAPLPDIDSVAAKLGLDPPLKWQV